MIVVTIPKELAEKGDLVIVPQEEYKDFVAYKIKTAKEFTPTAAQKKALGSMRRAQKEGKLLTYDEFARRLASLRKAKRS